MARQNMARAGAGTLFQNSARLRCSSLSFAANLVRMARPPGRVAAILTRACRNHVLKSSPGATPFSEIRN